MIHQKNKLERDQRRTKMKTLKTMILNAGAVVLLATGGLHAQTKATAEIPFAFSAQSTTLPAGEYSISAASTSRNLMVIRNVETRQSLYVMSASNANDYKGGRDKKNVVVFHRIGDRYFLAEVKTDAVQAHVIPSKVERELESEASGQPMAAVIVSTLSVR
jgi:hypothetical protein